MEIKTETTESDTATYHVRLTLEGDMWLAEVDEIPAVHTFGRTVGKAREHVVDALALWLNESTEAVRPRVGFEVPELPDSIRQAAQLAVGARVMADCINREASELMTAGASALVRDGKLSVRDAAEILGISHQRVHQILPDADRAIVAAAEIQDRQAEAAAFVNQYVAQHGMPPISFKRLDSNDVLAAVGLLLVGGAIGALTASSGS